MELVRHDGPRRRRGFGTEQEGFEKTKNFDREGWVGEESAQCETQMKRKGVWVRDLFWHEHGANAGSGRAMPMETNESYWTKIG